MSGVLPMVSRIFEATATVSTILFREPSRVRSINARPCADTDDYRCRASPTICCMQIFSLRHEPHCRTALLQRLRLRMKEDAEGGLFPYPRRDKTYWPR